MDRRRSEMKRGTLAAAVVLGAIGFLLAVSSAEAKPPAGKRYASMLVFTNPLSGLIETERGCLIFKRNGRLLLAGQEGSWEYVPGSGKTQFLAQVSVSLEDLPFPVPGAGVGTIERIGPGSSIGGTLAMNVLGIDVNASAAGTQAKKAACNAFAAGN
jgi:hypothetical protein